MLDLRFRWLWLGLGGVLVAAVCIGSLLPANRYAGLEINDKILHFASYFVLTVWFSGLYGRRAHYLLIAVIVAVLGAALDVMQSATATRYYEFFDILANAAGALVGLALSIFLLGGWCSAIERWIARRAKH